MRSVKERTPKLAKDYRYISNNTSNLKKILKNAMIPSM